MKILTNLTIRQKILILTAAGVVLVVAVFGTIGIRAVNQATEAMLEDRMIATQLLAGYLDEVLRVAMVEVQHTAGMIQDNASDEEIQQNINELESSYDRLSLSIQNIYVVDDGGDIT